MRGGFQAESRSSPIRTGSRTGCRAEQDTVLLGGLQGLGQCLCRPDRTCTTSSSPLTSGTM